MIFYLHYVLMTSGLSGIGVLLAVYLKNYSDASQGEIGVLLMSFPFVLMVIKPLFCSMADRKQAHKRYLILALLVELIGYCPFAVLPFFASFYQNHARASWYLLVIACHIGNGGLGVAWSLGDCLAVNMSQKNGTPFGRMRLMGTISWGVYGFIIGQINEVPFLPKYVPAFFILLGSIALEIVLVACWRDEDFEIFDPLSARDRKNSEPFPIGEVEPSRRMSDYIDSMPSSLGGTLRLNSRAASIMRDVLAVDDLSRRLSSVAPESRAVTQATQTAPATKRDSLRSALAVTLEKGLSPRSDDGDRTGMKNPQLILLKMFISEDGRLIKYILVFSLFGFLLAPMNFLFLSVEEVCHDRGYNFSQLAGSMMISLAAVETVFFLTTPWILTQVSRSIALGLGLAALTVRFGFYSGWYYSGELSPYWAVVGEWSIGISYGICCTIMADISLLFANQSRVFIPELRRMGYLSSKKTATKDQIESEERAVKIALRATMQALFDGLMTGLGQGFGALICGLLIEVYSWSRLWFLFCVFTAVSFFLHQLAELTRSRWSDSYKALEGTKAYEVMQLSQELDKAKKKENSSSLATKN